MNKEQARTFIIDELSKQVDRNDILIDLCRELDLEWKQAEELLREVEAFDGQQIARRQSPILIIIGLAVLLGGLALTTYGVWYYWGYFQMEGLDQIFYGQYAYGIGVIVITGLAMIVGGIIGFRKIIGGILG